MPGLHKAWQILLAEGEQVPIIDAVDLQREPERCVAAWCAAVGIARRDDALRWQAGMDKSWETWPSYVGTVVQSTGFHPPPEQFPEVTDERLARMIDSSRRYYKEMENYKVVV